MYRTVYPKKYAHGFCFAVLCCGYTLTDFPISTRLTSLALWQSNDCPSASKATLMNMDKYFIWNQYERLRNLNKAKHNKTVCIFLGIYCMCQLFVFQDSYFWDVYLYNGIHFHPPYLCNHTLSLALSTISPWQLPCHVIHYGCCWWQRRQISFPRSPLSTFDGRWYCLSEIRQLGYIQNDGGMPGCMVMQTNSLIRKVFV